MADPEARRRALLQERRAVYGPNTSLSYKQPLHIVRGAGARLFDSGGAAYLDCVNNVTHVGHANEAVNAAICGQLALVNTNSRYLSEGLVELSKQLLATLPPNLEVVYLCNSGSEANDLALRMARAAAAARAGRAGAAPAAPHVACMASAYHGHLTSTMAISPYKFWGAHGAGKEPWVHVLPLPDTYRGHHLDGAASARGALAEARAAGGEVVAFIAESVLSCGGQTFFPEGYLPAVYAEMRAAGAVCIADEVQCGFGRMGDAFWGFQLAGVAPDAVVFGKPMGNGFPLSAVAVTRELANTFGAQEYFNTFGGCNAAAAAGLAVLSEIRRLDLQASAARVGARLLARLRALASEHPIIGDVRGRGLFVGIEVVRCPASKAPAPAAAEWIKEFALSRRVLLSTDGPFDNVLKIKPPMVFSEADADELVGVLSEALRALTGSEAARAAVEEAEAARYEARVAPTAARYEENAARIYAAAAAEAAAAAAARKLALLGVAGAPASGGASTSSGASSDGDWEPPAAVGPAVAGLAKSPLRAPAPAAR
ncbi:ethanolamine-phosphate phospho-lyase [Raphidocelis subcapitata]|uniref:Ethanolamine-phosphate phospho-lyase n=1 Tax=Raphidocelis subcapitata TaxID=307507 RepID=A0A2V0PIZ9_9CHLO|nr:ethanolamine-phosphate phospho-lyase [Raphidocelis subcapitata]|eukprot:GBF99529.1 ethanolamine-phosphate phospho-lyase [Raphidocelis subcapitata]